MSKVDISKATPRPWKIGLSDADFSIDFPDSEGLTTITHVMAGDRAIPVAIVADDRPLDPNLSDAEFDANAALIILAVNSHDAMLASLKELLARDPGLWTPAIERARAAIRIAEGEETP